MPLATSARIELRNAEGEPIVSLMVFEIGGLVGLKDSQGRQRILLATGGNEEDAALLSITDGAGEDAVTFRVRQSASTARAFRSPAGPTGSPTASQSYGTCSTPEASRTGFSNP